MALLFIDEAGHEGRILDDLSVEYDGSEPVEEYVERIEEEAASNEQAVEDIIIDMIGDLNVKEVRRE